MKDFSPATRRWFQGAFEGPTPVQERGWATIATGAHALLVAPTGSGKTLAAFLWAIDRIATAPEGERTKGVRILYVSPLKALAYDVERNLGTPLVGIRRAADELNEPLADVRVDVRTGDTSQRDRNRQRRSPGEILVTTPESLFLLLGSAARENLSSVHTVIIDEVHALAPTKRGVHLALSLERLSAICPRPPQRIGLSATARPLEEIGRFLGGPDPVAIVDAGQPPKLDLRIEAVPAPVPTRGGDAVDSAPDDAAADGEPPSATAGERGVWPGVYRQVLGLIRSHTSTIVFVNSRGLCERLAAKLNEEAGEEIVRAHHGSVSHEKRRDIEEQLKRGAVQGIVATSSLELGVDMGAVDLVVLVDSPGSVARGLQRIGRAGHHVDTTSRGIIYPKFRGDLLEVAVVGRRMREAELESVRMPMHCLDVLAQQILAMVCDTPRTVKELEALVQRAAPYCELPRPLLTAVLDMLSGRYPSADFADLRPRVSWDRHRDVLKPRRGTAMLSRLNAGTIPDRGLYRVHIGEGGPRLGELDEEMVYELSQGEVVLLGTSSWRVLEITRDQVLVEPAPGESGKIPFWHGDGLGRSIELGRAMGAFLRELEAVPQNALREYLCANSPLQPEAADQLAEFVDEQREVSGTVPTDRRIVVERFRDELGDWRICVLSPYGGRVHAPWAMALQGSLSARSGYEVVVTYNDDGLVLTFADGQEAPEEDVLFPEPGDLEDLVTDQLDGSALFGSLFRENAARALLLPRRNPAARTPLWAQRLKAKNLLAAVMQHADFPIVLETYRHCMQDMFDLPGLVEILGAVQRREIQVTSVETTRASPFASSLVFAHVASYLYEQDAPLAERRTQALTLDRTLLRELMGDASLRDLIDPEVLGEVQREMQCLLADRRARDGDELHDVLRRLGALEVDALELRCDGNAAALLSELEGEGRASQIQMGGRLVWIATQDAGLYRDALGIAVPPELKRDDVGEVADALPALVRRFARTNVPFTSRELANALSVSETSVYPILVDLEQEEHLLHGALRPGGDGEEWCDRDVLRRLKRYTLARLRGEVAPVEGEVFARFLPQWQGLHGEPRAGQEQLLTAIEQLQGVPLPWSEWERSILPRRVADYGPELLDLLCASGQIVWLGRASLGSRDGRVALVRREDLGAWLAGPFAADEPNSTPMHGHILAQLAERGASFEELLVRDVRARCVAEHSDAPFERAAFDRALWDLVWAGMLTNDTFAPLRQLCARKSRRPGGSRPAMVRGRWSLVSDNVAEPVSSTQRAFARTTNLLSRYGFVSRGIVAAEELEGGFSALYPVLGSMEESGRVRRGLFVEGLEGAQFALPAAIDHLRGVRGAKPSGPTTCVLSSVDPANPWGGVLPWPPTPASPARPRRTAGSLVTTVDGAPILWLSANHRRLLTFPAAGDRDAVRDALAALADEPLRPMIVLETVDGTSTADWCHRDLLEECGFTRDYRGWIVARDRRRA